MTNIPKNETFVNCLLPGTSYEDRCKLLAIGWEPFPLKGKGRFGIPTAWPSVTITDSWLEQIARKHPDWGDTSLRTKQTPGIDIDTTDMALAYGIRDVARRELGDSLLWREGRKGGLLVFKADEPFRKIVLYFTRADGEREKVEVLADGQQFVAFGLHEDTGIPYKWPDRSPLDTPRSEVHLITYAMVSAMLKPLQEYLAAQGCHSFALQDTNAARGDRFDKPPASSRPVTPDLARAMLHSTPADCEDMKGYDLRSAWVKKAGAWKSARIVHPETFESMPDHDLFTDFDEHSSQAHNYPGTEETRRMWNSITIGQVGDAGFGSLKYLARQNGYKGATDCLMEMADSQIDAIPDLDPIAAAVAKINRRFAVVMGGPNQGTVVDLQNPAEPRVIDAHKFHLLYENRKIEVPGAKKPVAASRIWLASQDRRQISAILFEPPGSLKPVPAGAHNLWQGFAVQPKPGISHEPLLAHIREHVTDTEAEYQWLLAWLANMVQAPGRKPNTNVVLQGPQGCGKTVLADYMARILGDSHFCRVADRNQMTGRFNGHMASRVLLNAEEAFWAGDKQAEAILKNLVTSPTLSMERKFQDVASCSNHMRILVTSNEGWVVPTGLGDRRWMVFRVDGTRTNDLAYWKPIQDAKEGDGPAHLLHFLLHHRYEEHTLYRPIMNAAKADQTVRSLDPIEAFWFDVLSGGCRVMGSAVDDNGADDVFNRQVSKEEVYTRYEEWRNRRKGYADIADVFWRVLRKHLPKATKEFRSTIGSQRKRVYWFPTREVCQQAFADQIGCPPCLLFDDTMGVIEDWELLG